MVEWALWVMHLVDLRPAILLQPQWTLQMPLLVQLWTALWIKVVRPHRQVRKARQVRQKLACPLKTMAQR
jgi:nicotinamide riboside transporter PnuC